MPAAQKEGFPRKDRHGLRQTRLSRVLDYVTSPLRNHSRFDLAIRRSKVRILQARRLAQWARNPEQFPAAPLATATPRALLHAVEIDARGTQSHPSLEAGKIRNLRIAAAHFDGRELSASRGFSFWRLLGRPVRAKGFLPGTEIRDGCVVPTIGGGLCLLSGALFRLAAELDWTILERHGHTISTGDIDRIDATVFWPFVDLRFAPRSGAAVLRVEVAGDSLRVAAYGLADQAHEPIQVWRESKENLHGDAELSTLYRENRDGHIEVLGNDSKQALPGGLSRNCLTCNERQCRARGELLEAL